eukprot:INCI9373.1.p1 GENE.INCI9373.1~~INCI9373.1.p1  ORF type:complete len:723 (-),score=107.48 INCI9373.1:340-2367(-)
MERTLDNDTLKAFLHTRTTGEPMSKQAGNKLAHALCEWAKERGCRQYAHWFSPVRGARGLKHDGFFDYDYKGEGQQGGTVRECIEGFSAAKLFYNETDGSSFPNGGLRVTHRAAAFMNWDTTSPPFVRNATLYIPAGFVAHTGHALDEKTVLLRSQDAVSRAGVRLLHAMAGEVNGQGADVTRVVANVGWEQEFFVVDRALYERRPDLIAAGRTLIGAPPARGQQTDYNYFNKVPPAARAFFDAVQKELWAIGVSMTTFHNEVAPSQVEFCPIFKLTNIAADENALALEIIEDLSVHYGVKALLHEKPFAGINGSGKHCNWGVNTDRGQNLLAPGKTEESQAQFITFVAALTRTVHVHGDVMRVGVATSGNDHRLGAQEAPPAIISLYTGDIMERHIDSILEGGPLAGYGAEETSIDFGTTSIPAVTARLEDRNRTAPFPFCGNRFEFRAVGSSQAIGFPLALLNTAFAQSLNILAEQIEGGLSARDAVAETFRAHKPAIFNGNGYSAEWQEEAARRGLPNLRTSPDAYDTFASAKNIELFASQKVMTEAEVHARKEVLEEKYAADIELEATCLLRMVETGILPACAKDMANYAAAPALAGDRSEIYASIAARAKALRKVHAGIASAEQQARYCVENVVPCMQELREVCDRAEEYMEAKLRPFPSYEQILFKLQC